MINNPSFNEKYKMNLRNKKVLNIQIKYCRII